MITVIRILLGGALLMLAVTTANSAPVAPGKRKSITIERAERIALERVPGGVVEEIERDRQLGKDVFEIEVRAPDGREHELVLDASDGRVLSEEIDDDDDD